MRKTLVMLSNVTMISIDDSSAPNTSNTVLDICFIGGGKVSLAEDKIAFVFSNMDGGETIDDGGIKKIIISELRKNK